MPSLWPSFLRGSFPLARLLRRPPRWLLLALLLAGIVASYLFIITAGRWSTWSTWNTTYDEMAEGFRAGHLYTLLKAAPELVAARDPLDPALANYWIWDASYHKGHVYYYWGPLPAVILAALKTVFRWNFEIGDQYFVFAFYALSLLAGALLIDRMARRAFTEVPLWLVAVAILVFAYAHPTPYIIATPGTYQAAIIGAQAFLLLGMVFAADAVWNVTDGPPARRLLVGAGCCWGLAISTRVSVVLPIALLVGVTAVLMGRPGSARAVWWERARAALWMSLPLGAFAAALLIYNHARFDTPFEFGTGNQMSTVRYRTEWSYVWPNLYSYLLRPMVYSCRFPFFTAPFDLQGRAFPAGFQLPAGYLTEEPVAGMGLATPWIWLGLAGAGLGARAAYRALRRRVVLVALDARTRSWAWFGISFAIIGVIGGVPIIGQLIATMRYLVDVSAGLVLFALWGAWSAYSLCRTRPWPRRSAAAIVVAFAGTTIVLGLLLGVTGYNDMFDRNNPALFQRMVNAFSRCS